MSSARIAFQLAADAAYLRMTTAMVHAIAHYHPGVPIRLYLPDADRPAFASLARHVTFRTPPDHVLPDGGFHPLIWTKLEAARPDADADIVVALDPDQILYRSLQPHCDVLHASEADFAACTDNETVAGQFVRLPGPLAAHGDRPGLSSGTLLVRPSQGLYDAYLDAARRYARDARYPDQAVLAILAYAQGRWHPCGEDLQMLHFSAGVIDADHGACLVHLYTPRPDWCGPSPLRAGEPDFAAACAAFARATGSPYPEARLRADFLDRLADRWPA